LDQGKSNICIKVFNREFGLSTLPHSECDTKQNIFYNVKNVVDIPVIIVFFLGKRGGIQKEEKRRRKIDKKGDYHPEFLGLIYEENGGVFDLSVKE